MIKTFVQRAISWLPRSEWWNGLFQRYVTKGLRLDLEGEFRGKLDACRKHLAFFHANHVGRPTGFSVVELGTGWFPILPIGLYLCGASKVWTYDIVPLVSPDTLQSTLRCFLLMHDSGKLSQLLPALHPDCVERLRGVFSRPFGSPGERLGSLGIHLVLTPDIRQVEQAESSIDLIFSNGVLEHLPRRQLAAVFAVFRRWLKPTGVMSHRIGMADQFASFDRSITPFNFLRYSNKEWRWLDNPIIPQNRLRHSDYLRLIEAAGFALVSEEKQSGSEADLRSVKIAREFESYKRDDLLVLESWLVAKSGRLRSDQILAAEAVPSVQA